MATGTKSASVPQAAALVLEFRFDHDTKGALVFKEPDYPNGERPVVGSLYLTKAGVAKKNLGSMQRIRVTIEGIE